MNDSAPKPKPDWEVCHLEPGGKIETKVVRGYTRANSAAKNLRHGKYRDRPEVRIWVMREY